MSSEKPYAGHGARFGISASTCLLGHSDTFVRCLESRRGQQLHNNNNKNFRLSTPARSVKVTSARSLVPLPGSVLPETVSTFLLAHRRRRRTDQAQTLSALLRRRYSSLMMGQPWQLWDAVWHSPREERIRNAVAMTGGALVVVAETCGAPETDDSPRRQRQTHRAGPRFTYAFTNIEMSIRAGRFLPPTFCGNAGAGTRAPFLFGPWPFLLSCLRTNQTTS
jgi:hypothetical protein